MIKDIKETKILSEVVYSCKSEDGLAIGVEELIPAINSMLAGYVKFLANLKYVDTDEAILRISDKNGSFIVGVVVSKSTDDEGKVSFEVSFTVDEDDTEGAKLIYNLSDQDVYRFVNNSMAKVGVNKCVVDNHVYLVSRAFFVQLLAYLTNVDKKDLDDEGLTVKHASYLLGTVTEDDGKLDVAVEPGVDLKKFAKDDKLVEVQ